MVQKIAKIYKSVIQLINHQFKIDKQAKMSKGCRFLLFWHHNYQVTLRWGGHPISDVQYWILMSFSTSALCGLGTQTHRQTLGYRKFVQGQLWQTTTAMLYDDFQFPVHNFVRKRKITLFAFIAHLHQ